MTHQHVSFIFNVCELRPIYSNVDGSGPKVIKHFSCSTQLSTKFFLLINVEMPTIVVGI